MSLTAAQFISLTDKITAAYLAVKGTAASGYGAGDNTQTPGNNWGISLKILNLETIILDTADETVVLPMLAPTVSMFNSATYQQMVSAYLTSIYNSLGSACGNAGLSSVNGIDTFAAYYNTGSGGPFNALLAPDFTTVRQLIGGALPTNWQLNIYAPAISNMGAFTVGGSFTAGTSVNTTLYAGEAISQITVATLTGSGVVTVAGKNQNGVAENFTATASTDTTYTLAPTIAGDLLTSVTGISVASGITAGTITVSGAIPTGRVDPPT